jgi:N-acetylmuramoyl-L-alanine amidase
MSPTLRTGALTCALVIGGVAAFQQQPSAAPPVAEVARPVTPALPTEVIREAAQVEAVASVPAPPAPVTPPRPPAPRSNRRDRFPEPALGPADWRPPAGPVKIALQAGHWRANEAPRELSGLKDNGTRWQNLAEWENNLEVARRTQTLLEDAGYQVELLPAVVPPGYRAHLFIAIHADGHRDPTASGFRAASPRRDLTGRAARFAELLEEKYGEVTGLRRIPDVTRRMQNYYAFNYRRYEHALHPMTIGVILETGFLTSPADRSLIVEDRDRVARGIVDAVMAFPETQLQPAGGPTQ